MVAVDSVLMAFKWYRSFIESLAAPYADRWGGAAVELPVQVCGISWGDGIAAGVEAQVSAPRKDRVIRRSHWQFGDRTEHLALLAEDD